MSPKMRQAIKFFAEHAGYATPPGRMACAKAMAEAESMAAELGLEVKWEHEQASWLEFVPDYMTHREAMRKFDSGEWEVYHAYVEGDGGEILASLGGIILASDGFEYKRVVEAELFQEAIASLRKGE